MTDQQKPKLLSPERRQELISKALQKQSFFMETYISPNWKSELTSSDFACAGIAEIGELLQATQWKWWTKQEPKPAKLALIELVDILHFIFCQWLLKYGSEFHKELYFPPEPPKSEQEFRLHVSLLAKNIVMFFPIQAYRQILNLTLGLGFSEEDLFEVFFKKLEQNIARQKSGYKNSEATKWLLGLDDENL